MRLQPKCCRCFRGRVAGNIKKTGNPHAAIGYRHREVADLVHQPRRQHGAIEFTAALKHQFSQLKSLPELLKSSVQVDFLPATEQIRNSDRLEMREIIIAHALCDQQHDVIASDFIFLEAQDAFGVGADRQPVRVFIGDLVAPSERLWSSRQFRLAAVELIHRGCAHQPRADAETGGGVFEKIAFMFITGKFSPAIAEDFAIDGRAHMTDHVRSHEFSLLRIPE